MGLNRVLRELLKADEISSKRKAAGRANAQQMLSKCSANDIANDIAKSPHYQVSKNTTSSEYGAARPPPPVDNVDNQQGASPPARSLATALPTGALARSPLVQRARAELDLAARRNKNSGKL
jgi:hypothetical protein